MNVLCFKCLDFILEKYLAKCDKVILIREQWDLDNTTYPDGMLEKVYINYVVKSIDSIEEISSIYADLMCRGVQIDKVVAGAEYGIFAAGYFKALLYGNDKDLMLAINSRDKRLMKQQFRKAGINCAKYETCLDIPSCRVGEGESLNYPVVAKPVCGVATYNTEIIHNKDELTKYFDELEIHPAIASSMITLEEYIKGDEYHADIVWRGQKCHFISIGKYLVPRIDIMQHPELNGSCILSKSEHEDLYDAIEKMHIELAKEMNLSDGVTHTEFFIKDGVIYFSEIATRYGGAYIAEAIQCARGVDIVDEWVRAEVGEESIVNTSFDKYECCGWLNLCPMTEGIIQNVPSEEELLEVSWIKKVDIRIKPGEYYSLDNPSIWCIFMVIQSEDMQDFKLKVKEVFEKFKILTK